MKFRADVVKGEIKWSPPTRAEWIEIVGTYPDWLKAALSPPTRAEWIEIDIIIVKPQIPFRSPPTRAEWIEME